MPERPDRSHPQPRSPHWQTAFRGSLSPSSPIARSQPMAAGECRDSWVQTQTRWAVPLVGCNTPEKAPCDGQPFSIHWSGYEQRPEPLFAMG